MLNADSNPSEWQTSDYALTYLARADRWPHRAEGERMLLEQIPQNIHRVLDLGTGDGRTLALVRRNRPDIESVALDFSEPMIRQALKRFATDKQVRIVKHDLDIPLPKFDLGVFDVVVSSFAIHHLTHERKRQLYQEVFDLLNTKGVFCNLEHVSSATNTLHVKFLAQVGKTPETEDKSNKLLDVETQLQWLREIGFADVDCYWKWREFALLVGVKP
jgi:tRNA (cmo5U34)-methyltransferase